MLWRRSRIEMAVYAPIPQGLKEVVSGWGWPDESPTWNWKGHEGEPLAVAVYSRCERVRLLLNGKSLGERPVSAATRLTARFDVPTAPGELRAVGLVGGKAVAQSVLRTAGAPRRLRLAVDRKTIRADRDDLAYVTVEVVDADGRRVPDAEIDVRLAVSGAGELAAQGNGAPNRPASFRLPVAKTFEGRALAILRPTRGEGRIALRATATGLPAAHVEVTTRRPSPNGRPR